MSKHKKPSATSVKLDWQRIALALMHCFGTLEGTFYENEWKDFGIPVEWHAKILRKYRSYLDDDEDDDEEPENGG